MIIAVGYSVLNVVVQTLIQPKVVGDRVQLNTTLTFLALIIWTFLLGGLGAILAIPMTLLIRALFVDSQPQHRWVRALFSSGPPPGTARQEEEGGTGDRARTAGRRRGAGSRWRREVSREPTVVIDGAGRAMLPAGAAGRRAGDPAGGGGARPVRRPVVGSSCW